MRVLKISLVAIVAATFLFNLGCSSKKKGPPPDILDTMQSAILEEVEDPDRARAAVALVEELNTGLDNYVRMTMVNRALFRDLNRAWPFDESAHREFYEELAEDRLYYQQSMLDFDQALRELMTEKEWKKVQKKLADRVTRYFLGIPEERV